MSRRLTSALACAAFIAGPAAASTYHIDGLINVSEQGFGSTLIHEQDRNGDMSGSTVGYFDEMVGDGGVWEHDGSISFSGLWDGSAYTASGVIDQSDATGMLTFVFDMLAPFETLTFNFAPLDMGLPNSFDGDTIYLWGETGTCAGAGTSCYGIDMRVAVSQVPLPASAVLLLAGLGALTLRRKTTAA